MRILPYAIAMTWLASTTASLAAPDLVILNAKIFTADQKLPYAQAVAVEKGSIAFVGSTEGARKLAGKGTRVIDAGGHLVVPGLIEAHGHAGPYPAGKIVELPGLPWPGPTPDQALDAVRRAAVTERGWLLGTIGAAIMADQRDWRTALDGVAPDTPVLLRPWWGHGMTVNSRALEVLGIKDSDPDPVGGWYGRTAEGRLNGRIRERAEIRVIRRLSEAVSPAEAAKIFAATGAQYARWGVTSFHQMANNLSLKSTLAALSSATPTIKWSIYAWGLPNSAIDEAWGEFSTAGAASPLVRIAGSKWMLDATPIERDAHLREAYQGSPGNKGRPNYTPEEVRQILRGALKERRQLALHVSGDGEMARLFGLMEEVAPAATWRHQRVRIEHGDGLTPDLLPMAKRLGVILVENPLHVAPSRDETGGEMMVTRLGEKRARDFQLLKSVVTSGVPLALGSDAGGEVANPFLNIMLAVRYDRNPAEALTREQALIAYTSGAAYAEQAEKRKGAIAVGKAADLAVLSQDILTAPLERLPATRSLLTLVDGRAVHEDSALRN
ncbi:amidohydrolase [Sphingomonas sp.]|uniref:amidohydrolase n=1 Tax=Sphingomonas sp. TaxID=28214 RepID=UPI002E1562F3